MGSTDTENVLPIHNDNTYRPPAQIMKSANGTRPGTFRRTMSTVSRLTTPKRLPWTQWMNSNAKNHFVASLGEFVGTTLFLFLAFAGTMVANIPVGDAAANTTSGQSTGPNPSTLLYISLIFGFSLAVNAWVFFRVSGGLFNPAVTLGMVLVGIMPAFRGCFLFLAQMLGGICAAAIAQVLFPTPLNVRTTLSGGTTIPQGIFIEMFLTAQLVFTIFMLAAEKHRATFIAPVGIGLSLFIAELVGVYYTGGSLNPARSFGPCVVTKNFDNTHWIYWLGPGLGACLASAFYKFIKVLEYETANPGQDAPYHNEPYTNVTRHEGIPVEFTPGSNPQLQTEGEARAMGEPGPANEKMDV